VRIRATRIKAGELQPGDLFSTVGQDYWDGACGGKGAMGERVYIRTEDPCPPEQTDEPTYRVTVVRKTTQPRKRD
jgi:hypothetical protein